MNKDKAYVDEVFNAVAVVIPPLIPNVEAILNALPDPD